MIKDLNKNRIELMEVLKQITEIVSEHESANVKNKVSILLHQAYMLCIENATLLNDYQDIKQNMDNKDREELELEKQAEDLNELSKSEIQEWIKETSYKT